jgi:glyoxylase-like metal-dependent hydrolase (beta-lactamase superfamily II)
MSELSTFPTSAGRMIYSFPVQAFPMLVANIYVIDDGDQLILVDTGSGREESNAGLLAGFEALGEKMGRPVSLADLDLILVTHGHVDHFGGLPFVRQFTDAPIGVHILDRRILSHYEERVIVAARRLERFLEGAGVSVAHRDDLMQMYLFAKGVYRSTPVQFLLDEVTPVAGIEAIHVPGHCPGQVCLRVDDILLTADHVLSRTTPHQAPESITMNMGLGHYLDALDKIAGVEGVRLALGGHEEPIEDLAGRVAEIRKLHEYRLQRLLDICSGEPLAIREISREMFGRQHSYHILLALEETGAHVEYLYQRGELVAANLDEIEQSSNPVIRYRGA